MPASWMILIHLSYSDATNGLSRSGPRSITSPPFCSKRGLSSGNACAISFCRRAIAAGGVLAGANSPIRASAATRLSFYALARLVLRQPSKVFLPTFAHARTSLGRS